jgi:hypothetical protein
MSADIIAESESVAHIGLGMVREALQGDVNQGEDARKESMERARLGLSVLKQYGSLRSTRAREASVLVSMAKATGARGEGLRPVFAAALPAAAALGSERSSAEAVPSVTDQSVSTVA